MQGSQNTAADSMSRVGVHALHTSDTIPVVGFTVIAAAQADDPDLACIHFDASLLLEAVPLALSNGTIIICDVSTGVMQLCTTIACVFETYYVCTASIQD